MAGQLKQWINVLFQNKQNTKKCIILMKQINLGRNNPEFTILHNIEMNFPFFFFFNRYRKKFWLLFSLWGEIKIIIFWYSNNTGHCIYRHMPHPHAPSFSKSRFLLCAQSIFSLLTGFIFQISKDALGRISPPQKIIVLR